MQGKFIVLEGIDGAGKSTQVKHLAQGLRAKGISILEVCAPRREGIGAEIREILCGKLPNPGPLELQRMMMADRWGQAQEIEAQRASGTTVIGDRWWYSGMAYGCADGVDFADLWELNKAIMRPDLAIWIDVPVNTALGRIKGDRELFEREEALIAVAAMYRRMADDPGFPEFVRVDGLGEFDEVAARIERLVRSKFFPEV